MKKRKTNFKLVCAVIFTSMFLTVNEGFSQTTPTIVVNGDSILASNVASSPFWLGEGKTLKTGNLVKYISVLQYKIAVSGSGGNDLQFDSVLLVTAQKTVPLNKAWKIEAVGLYPTAPIFGGDNLGNHVATTHLTMSNNKVSNVANPADASDAANCSTIQNNSLVYASDAGIADAYSVTLFPSPSVYTAGLEVIFKAANSNTGASTLNVNGLGAKAIKKQYSSDLTANDIMANQIITVIYDGVNFQFTSLSGNAATGGTACLGAPPVPGQIYGPGSVCANGTTPYTYMVPAVAGATIYTWNYTGGSIMVSGQTNPVSIYFPANTNSGDLTVTASCGNGNSTSAAFPITIPHSSQTFNKGISQTWTVPANVCSITIEARGAQGSGSGGKGGLAKGSLAVTAGQVLYINVGGQDGTNGGGTMYTDGGGASDVRIGGTGLGNRIIVAGGGGGGGTGTAKGGDGGGNTGAKGDDNTSTGGGYGGTQVAGGAGGYGSNPPTAGSLGQGGNSNDNPGGAGGGGYYGGGGGGAYNSYGAGGGGGSNYLGGVIPITNSQGIQTGDGQVIITW